MMKVVLLAGGFGTRISEESHLKPKPMIEIGGLPILCHIMKLYSHYGFNEFIICCGYRQFTVKEFFSTYYLHKSDVTVDFSNGGEMSIHNHTMEDWRVTLVDTGLHTMTGGRIKRVKDYIGNEPFLMTYGDGVSDINIQELVHFHQSHGKILTLSAVSAKQRFGVLDIDEQDKVQSFREKYKEDDSKINGGYMVINPEIFNYIAGDSTIFEAEPIETLAQIGELMAYRHTGFWQCMDTQRDKFLLEELWVNGAPWKVWKD